MNEEQFQYTYGLYKENPYLFNDDQVDKLSMTASHLGTTFERDMESSEFSLRRTLSQLGSGFVSGFTTLEVGDAPENTIEGIARGIGSLMGFVGYIPNPVGIAGRLSTTAIARAAGIRTIKTNAATRVANIQSLPMFVADKVVKKFEKTSAASAALNFLGERGMDVATEGIRLGTATGFASWQQGIDSMLKGALLGGLEGAAFKGIANTVNLGDKNLDMGVRAAANAIYSGLPSTLNDDPLELQVYQYLLGTYFGINDRPYHQIKAEAFMQRGIAENMHDPVKAQMVRLSPQLIDGYKSLDPQIKDELRQQSLASSGRWFNTKESDADTVDNFTTGTAVVAKGLAGTTGNARLDALLNTYQSGMTDAMKKGADEDGGIDAGGEAIAEAYNKVALSQEAAEGSGPGSISFPMSTEGSSIADRELPSYSLRPIREISKRSENGQVMEQALREHFSGLAGATDSKNAQEILDGVTASVLDLDPTMKTYMAGEGRRLLRQTMRSYVGSTAKSNAYVQDGEIMSTDGNNPRVYTGSGNLNIERIHPSWIEEISKRTEMPFIYLNKESVQKSVNYRADQSLFEGDTGIFDILNLSAGRYVPTQMNKDSGELILSDGFLFERVAPFAAEGPLKQNQVEPYLRSRHASISEVDGGKHVADYTKLKKEFLANAEENGVTSLRGMNMSRYYDAMATHNMMFLEQLNPGVRFEEMIANPGRFITDPFAYNKRMQLFADKNPPASPEFYQHIPDIAANNTIPYVIVNDLRSVKGLAESIVDGGKRLEDVATDGATPLHYELFDAMVADGGLDPETGAIKGSAIYGDEMSADGSPLGAVLQKTAYFRLDEASSKKLYDETGAYMLSFDSAIKQRGFRERYDMRIGKTGKISFNAEGQSDGRKKVRPQIYQMPIDALRINHTSSENTAHSNDSQILAVQLAGAIDDPIAIRHHLKTFVDPAFEGNVESTLRYEKGDFKNYSTDDLSLQYITDQILPSSSNDFQKNPEIYKRIWNDILSKDNQPVDADFDMTMTERPDSGAARLFDALRASNNITPATMHLNESLHKYAMGAFRNYALNRALKGKVKYSGSSILNPTDPFFRHDMMVSHKKDNTAGLLYNSDPAISKALKGGEVPEGYVYFGDGHKKRKIKWLDGESTLENAFDEYRSLVKRKQRSPENSGVKDETLRRMEDLLTLTTVRVPAATREDVRRLKVLGFTGRKGAHIVTNDKDTKMMGGADHDIDKAFWYQDIDGLGTGRGPIAEFFNNNPKSDYVDPKEGFRERFLKKQEDHHVGTAAMIDPMRSFEVGKNAYVGNKAIGIPATAIRRINAVQSQILGKQHKGTTYADDVLGILNKEVFHGDLRSKNRTYKPFRIAYEGQMIRSKDQFGKAINATLQMSADAATDPLMFGPEQILREMSRDLFSKVKYNLEVATIVREKSTDTFDDDGKAVYKTRVKYVPVEEFLKKTGSKYLQKRQEAVKEALGKLEGFTPSLNDLGAVKPLLIADGAQSSRTRSGERNEITDLVNAADRLKLASYGEEYGSSWYEAIKRFSKLNPSRIGRDLVRDNRLDPELIDWVDVGRDKRGNEVYSTKDPTITTPVIAPSGIRDATARVNPIFDKAKKGDAEAQLSVFLAGGVQMPRDASFNYDQHFKVVNDVNDVASFEALDYTGRLAVAEIGTQKEAKAVIAEIQKKYSTPARLNMGLGFRQRLAHAAGTKEPNALFEGGTYARSREGLDEVYSDMSRYAEELQLKHGPNTRKYFEMLAMSSAKPSPVSVEQVRGRVASPGEEPIRSVAAQAFLGIKSDPVKGANLNRFIENAVKFYEGGGENSVYPRRSDFQTTKEYETAMSRHNKSRMFAEQVGLGNPESRGEKLRGEITNSLRMKYINQTADDVNSTGQLSNMLQWDGLSAHTMAEYAGFLRRVVEPSKTMEPLTNADNIVTPNDAINNADKPRDPSVWAKDLDKTKELVFGRNAEIIKLATEKGAFDPATKEGARANDLSDRLTRVLTRQPDLAEHIAEILPGVLEQSNIFEKGTSLRFTTLDDIDSFVSFFEAAERGTLMEKLMKDKNPRQLPKWAYFFFPDTVGRWALPYDYHITEQVRSKVMTSEGVVDGGVRKVVSTGQELRNLFKMATANSEKAETVLRADVDVITRVLGDGGANKDARELMTVATVLRELHQDKNLVVDDQGNVTVREDGSFQFDRDTRYWDRWKDVKKTYDSLANKKYRLNLPNKDGSIENREVTGEQLMGSLKNHNGEINKMITKFIEKSGLLIRNVKNESENRFVVYSDKVNADPNKWVVDYDTSMRKIQAHIDHYGAFPDSPTLHQLHNLFYEHQLRYDLEYKVSPTKTGSLEDLKHRGIITEKGYKRALKELREQNPFEYQDANPYELVEVTLGKGITKQLPLRKNKVNYGALGLRDPNTHWPHNNHDQQVVKRDLKAAMDKLETISDPVYRRKIALQLQRAAAEGTIGYNDLSEHALAAISDQKRVGSENPGSIIKKIRPLQSRGEIPLGGWDPTERALYAYSHSLTKGRYDLFATLMANKSIRDFEVKRPMDFDPSGKFIGNFSEAWANWHRTYLNTFLGHNTMYSDDLLSANPTLRQSAAYMTSDRAAWDTYKKVNKYFGDNSLEGVGVDDPQALEFSNKLRRISTLDGKYQMMTLLANTTAFVNNVVGGNMMTAVSTGFRPWLRTFNMKHFTRINPEWKTFEDVRRFAEKSGAIESWYVEEAALSGGFTTDNAMAFLRDFTGRITKNVNLPDSELIAMAKRHGLGDDFVNTSAVFMRSAERDLRFRSFMAHYMKARDVLGAGVNDIKHDDPWVMKMALRGVEGTQFLYHGSERPIFAASSLGKIFSRFQLWSWNSIRFRRDVYKSAKKIGIRPGTEEFDRFKRTSIADLFMFGLAAALPFSMFESTLPAPMNYISDLGDYFFGDEDEKKKAFFGVLPYPLNALGAVLPPASRVITGITSLASGDIDRFVDYNIYTFVPFGLLTRRIVKTVNNPTMAVEYMTGFPLHQFGRNIRNARDENSGSLFVPDTQRASE